MLLSLDLFKEPMPAFNIAGNQHVRTHCGGCVSLVMMYVLFLFSTLKLQHLLSKHNPQVNTFKTRDAFDETDMWYAEEDEDFMIAFVMTNFIDFGVRHDPNYVKWFAEYVI